jgi:hypothetical protein
MNNVHLKLAAMPHGANADNAEEERYRLLSVDSVPAPAGCAGPDWFVYRISQGANAITGYRRGNSDSVRAEADAIVTALNERREWRKSKAGPKSRRTTGAVPARTAPAPAAE